MDRLKKCEGCQFWLELSRFSNRGQICRVCKARRRTDRKQDIEIDRLRSIISNHEHSSRMAGFEVATLMNNINVFRADNTRLSNENAQLIAAISSLSDRIHYMQVEQRVWFNLMAGQIIKKEDVL